MAGHEIMRHLAGHGWLHLFKIDPEANIVEPHRHSAFDGLRSPRFGIFANCWTLLTNLVGAIGLEPTTPTMSKQSGILLRAQLLEHLVGQLPRVALDADDQLPPHALESLHGIVVVELNARGK